MDDTTVLLMQLVKDVAELKADMKNIKERLNLTDDKCEDCKPSTEVKTLKERFDTAQSDNKNYRNNKLIVYGILASFLIGVTTLILQITKVIG